jgi:hypothetical protein
MYCASCGTTLPSGATMCPSCSKPTPYNIATPKSNNPQVDASSPPMNFGPMRETVSSPSVSQAPGGAAQPTAFGIGTPAGNFPATPGSQLSIQPAPQDTPPQPNHVPAQPQPSTAQQVPQGQHHRISTASLTLLVILLALLIIGVSGIGYYAAVVRPAGFHAQATAVTENLLNTQAQATAQAYAQATATTAALTPQDIYTRATSGTPVINDPLDVQQGSSWLQMVTSHFSCAFSGGAYHIRFQEQMGNADSIAFNSLFNDLAFQVQVKIIAGAAGGLLFRVSNTDAYLFYIDPHATFYLVIIKNKVPSLLTDGRNAAINSGLNQPNLLTVVAQGNHIYLYVNKQPVAHVTNGVIGSGQVALFAGNISGPTDVAFNNAQIWAL